MQLTGGCRGAELHRRQLELQQQPAARIHYQHCEYWWEKSDNKETPGWHTQCIDARCGAEAQRDTLMKKHWWLVCTLSSTLHDTCRAAQREQSESILTGKLWLITLIVFSEHNYNSNILNQNHFNEIASISRFACGGDFRNCKPSWQSWRLRGWRAGESKMKAAIILGVMHHPSLYNPALSEYKLIDTRDVARSAVGCETGAYGTNTLSVWCQHDTD